MDPLRFQMPLRRFFRKWRFRQFVKNYSSCRTILDLGGAYDLWPVIGRRERIVILNIDPPKKTGGFNYVIASGCELPFSDKSFDLTFSNSAIEHVDSEENQFKFAREMMRVGARIYCQPSRFFPVDPHLSSFFLHWLPVSWLKLWFLGYFTLNGWLWKRPYCYDVTWITKRKLRKTFPGCEIRTERFLLWPKSYVVTN